MSYEPDVGVLATSIDGRHFAYEVPVDRLELARRGIRRDRRWALRRTPRVRDDVSPAAHDRRIARVDGRLLEGHDEPFGERCDPRGDRRGGRSLARRRCGPRGRSLEVGTLAFAEGVPLALDAGAFDRHTFLCGQSGSGKTYALGTILERLLAETSLRIVVLDPNSDFVRLAELRDDVGDDVRASATRRGRRGSTSVARAMQAPTGSTSAFATSTRRSGPRCSASTRSTTATSTRRSPRRSRAPTRSSPATVRETVERLWDAARALALARRACAQPGHRPLADLVGRGSGSLEELVQPGGPRCVVADLGSLATREEQAVAAEAVLAALVAPARRPANRC